jgi:galactose mutarotase-like enzyme
MPEFEAVTLKDPSSSLTATFVPAAGMIGTSLSDEGVEFLGQRRGLEAYVTLGKTMGIPILYPWANRLSANNYGVDGAVVTLTPDTGGVHTDDHGAPMHGLLTAYPGWVVTAQSGNELTAEVDFGATPSLLAYFPFPHLLTQTVTLADRTLRIETTVTPTTAASVPMCFGYHPYFTIPGVPRPDWTLTTPAMRHLPVDEFGIPVGTSEEWPASSKPLGDTTYDDGFDMVPECSVFAIEGGGRRVEVTYEKDYPCAQLFAPPNGDLIAIEPMTAPTDALRRGNFRVAVAGNPEAARFSIKVT